MKTAAIILFACIGYTLAAFTPFDAISSIYKQMSRMKRDVAPGQSDCFASCVNDMVLVLSEKMKTLELPIEKPSSLTAQICLSHNPTVFDAACEVYKPFDQCLNACPNDQKKTMVLKSLSVHKFICVDRYDDFKQHLPCQAAACDNARPTCESGCKTFQTVSDKAGLQLAMDINPENFTGNMVNMLSSLCGYVDCTTECLYPKYKSECGPESEKLEKELMQKAIISVGETMQSSVPGFEWPNSCYKLRDNTYKIGYKK